MGNSAKGNLSAAFVFTDFADILREALAILADVPVKYRNVLGPALAPADAEALRLLAHLRRDKSLDLETARELRECMLTWTVGFETALRLDAVAPGRLGLFLERVAALDAKIGRIKKPAKKPQP